jgi:hypothetical protein
VTKHAVISVPSNVLEAVAKWTSPDDSRPHIRQVLFAKGVMVALDAMHMVIVPCETFGMTLGVDRDYLFAAVAAQRAMRVDRSHGRKEITIEPGPPSTPALADGPSTVRLGIGPSDGTRRVSIVAPAAYAKGFPNYEYVVEQHTHAESDSPVGYGLNPAYLAAIADVHHATTSGGGASEGVKLVAWSKDHLGAMVFESTVGVKFFVMPMRI